MKFFRKIINKIAYRLIPNLQLLDDCKASIHAIKPVVENVKFGGEFIKINYPAQLRNVNIGNYSYLGQNANVSYTIIGKFCSVGPNFICGFGLHPINGISTAPMFYSATNKSNGTTICSESKCNEHADVQIGNDVFIGANVFVKDGVRIGDGAVIGAGAVVVNDIPDYAVAGGVPAKVIKYRLPEEKISKLKEIQWWNFSDDKLQDVEKYFYDIDGFINKCENQ